MYSKIILACLLAVATAGSYSQDYKPAYAQPAAAPEPEPEVNIDYKMSMYVQDDPSYNYQTREESKEGQIIKGQYTVLEPTGELRIVKYYADETGFHADVQNQAGYSKPYKAPEPAYPQAAPAYEIPAYPQSVPAYKAPEHSAPAYKVPEHSAPAYKVPEHSAPAYRAPEHSAPAYKAPEHSAPAYKAPEQAAPEYKAPEQAAPAYAQESESAGYSQSSAQESSSSYSQSSESQSHYGASAASAQSAEAHQAHTQVAAVPTKPARPVKLATPVIHKAAVPVPQMIFFQSAPKAAAPKPTVRVPVFFSAPDARYHQEHEESHSGY